MKIGRVLTMDKICYSFHFQLNMTRRFVAYM